jgi:hypothetical protein
MTDGLENASTDYDAHAIAELVRRYDERPNWTFVYLGAGHDSIHAARDTAVLMGYKADNAMRWAHDPASARKSMRSLAYATEQRRRAPSLKSEMFFVDAGQTVADYQHDMNDPAPHEPPARPAPRRSARVPTTIRRQKLTDALFPEKAKDERRRRA